MLFLDFDGTIIDDTARHYATYIEVLAMPDIRGSPIPEREYWALRRRCETWEEILRMSRLFPTKLKLFRERFEARLETPEMLMLDRLRPGTDTTLGKLYTKTPIILVTQRREIENLESQLAELGIRKYFTTVLGGAPVRTRRVDKDARWKHKAELVRRRYKVLPTEAVYVGDTETDVKAARDLKFEVFLVEGGHRTKDLQVKADPDRIVADFPASLRFLLPGGRWQR